MSILKPWLFVITLLFCLPALAATHPTIDIQLFVPVPDSKGFFTTESAEVNKHLMLSFGANLSYGHGLLEVVDINPDNSQENVGNVVANRVDLNLLAALGLYGRGQFGIALPLVWQNGFDSGSISAAGINLGTQSLRSVTLGNLRLLPKLNLVNLPQGAFAVALLPTLTIPTAGSAPYVGEAGLVFAPEVALSSRIGPTRLGFDLGYRWRKSEQLIAGITVGNELFFKAAAALDLGLGSSKDNPVELIVEAFGNTPPKAIFGLGNKGVNATLQQTLSPFEVDAGLRIVLGSYIITVGGGGGVLPGYGDPAPRVFVGTTYYSGRSILPDADNDGIPDMFDKCPNEPEDFDGFQDEDGCPDPDNDGDGVLDDDDQCPNEPEDKDGFQDEDGCPDLDNDNDGIPDTVDKCPNEPEDKDGFQDEDGCPDLDNDNDGIPDTLDKCPNEPEDLDGFQDEDGCPDLDNDGDGLPDLNDQCPNEPEDKDGFQDEDGCPDPDNDADGIPDTLDKCPNEPETYNGFQDEDGCPDKAPVPQMVKVTHDKIEIKEAIYFKAASSVILPRSFDLLNQVYAVLKNYQHITLVRIAGHTDNLGNRKQNVALSKARANAVMAYLVNKGIDKKRLEAVGFGPDKPIANNKTEAGRQKNRRVEFVIVSQRSLNPPSVKPKDVGVQIKIDVQANPAAPKPAATGAPASTPGPMPAANQPAPLLDLTHTKEASKPKLEAPAKKPVPNAKAKKVKKAVSPKAKETNSQKDVQFGF